MKVSIAYLHFHFLMAKQRHQERHDARVDDHLDLLVSAVCQVRQRPHRVHQNLLKEGIVN